MDPPRPLAVPPRANIRRVEAPEGVQIRRLDPGEIELVRPLWEALLEHHGRVSPALPPIRSPEDSWRRRRAEYDDWLGRARLVRPGGGVRGDEPVGYVLVLIEPGDDTWSTDERIAVIQTLSVDPGWRGRGVGTRAHGRRRTRSSTGSACATSSSARWRATRARCASTSAAGLVVSLVHFYGRRGA